ncbi:hypothetical protein BG004_004067 [Podila humilis]|nr:hypothetical protein BG004_004067 [Podila humilis]
MAQQKVSFKKWWKNITGNKPAKVGLFHIDLVDSIEYAGVPVNYTVNGKTRCQGYIPTIVSRCGWLLKEQAITTRGIFRVSGSAKRVSELQLIFDTPPTYGSQLDWTGFSIHDASNVLRRYLNYLPDPVITLEYYEKFRDVYRDITDDTKKIAAYQELISKLPPPHSCLLMYLLDLLALFAHHSEENLMDSKNLASVFQPGVLSHPSHNMSPGEYMTSAAVLKFLIDNQSSFTMPQPNIDEEDEETNFGLGSAPHQIARPGVVTFKTSHYHGGFVNAVDHERLYNTPQADHGSDDAASLDAGIKRMLSLHKPITEYPALPGNSITRSKSTNSSISSRHSVQSGVFSANFLSRRRSSRNSKTSSKVFNAEEDIAGISEEQQRNDDPSEQSQDPGAAEQSQLTPRSSVIRKAVTSPLLDADDQNAVFVTRRKQLRSDGLNREPSIFCETIEIPFPAPSVGTQESDNFRPSSAYTALSIPRGNLGDRLGQSPGGHGAPARFASESQLQYSTRGTKTSLSLVVDRTQPPGSTAPPQQRENVFVPPQQQPSARAGLGIKRASATPRKEPPERPAHTMNIQRAKSNPGDLVSISARHQKDPLSTSHNPGNHTYEMLKGWISGKNKDHESSDKEKSGKKRESLTEKQRKYRSQEAPPPSHHGSSVSSSTLWDTPVSEQPEPSQHAYQRPPPNTPPPRPPPPPPESSLMDILDYPPQRLGQHSQHSSPAGSRSGSPSRTTPSSSAHYSHPANSSITLPSSRSAATSHSDRLYHGRGLQQHQHQQHQHHPGGGSVYYDQHHLTPSLSSSYHLRQQSNSSFDNISEHNSGGSHPYGSSNNSRHNSFEALPIPIPARSMSRSRQPSFGSNHDPNNATSVLASDQHALSPPPKSRERRASPHPGSGSPLQKPPSRNQSRSRNPSPAPSSSSPSLAPLSSSSFGGHSHHGPSPLAEGHGSNSNNTNASSSDGHLHSTPSSRARHRAQSRDDSNSSSSSLFNSHHHSHSHQHQHQHHHQVTGNGGHQSARDRSRSIPGEVDSYSTTTSSGSSPALGSANSPPTGSTPILPMPTHSSPSPRPPKSGSRISASYAPPTM